MRRTAPVRERDTAVAQSLAGEREGRCFAEVLHMPNIPNSWKEGIVNDDPVMVILSILL